MSAMVERAGGRPRLSSGLDMAGLGARLRLERLRRRLSLYSLMMRTGVSRSMLSEVERGSKVPTVLVLDRIATGLGTSIARLLGDERAARVVVLRRGEHDTAHDPSGWERRIPLGRPIDGPRLAPSPEARPASRGWRRVRYQVPPGWQPG